MSVPANDNTRPDAPGPAPPDPALILLSVRDLARLLGRSGPSLRRDDAAGRLPRPVRIGGSKKWRGGEILAWVVAGCPGRDDWTWTATNKTTTRSRITTEDQRP